MVSKSDTSVKKGKGKPFRSKFGNDLRFITSGINWADFERDRELFSIGTGKEIDRLLSNLFSNLTEQQFLYDTHELDTLMPRLRSVHALYGTRDVSSERASLLLSKLIAHEAYGIRDHFHFAVLLLIDANRMVGSLESKQVTWYRIFFLDHAINRMLPNSMGCRDERERAHLKGKRDEFTAELEALLPNALKGNSDATNNSDPLLLRAAHYWGHRGNHRLEMAQSATEVDPQKKEVILESEPAIAASRFVEQVEDGVRLFERAVEFRVRAFAHSFPGDDVISFLMRRYNIRATETQERTVEKFKSRAQALADIANQFSAQCCLLCHLASLPENWHPNRDITERILASKEMAEWLWRQANEMIRIEGGVPLRTMLWRRLYEHMTFKVVSYTGRPRHFYEESLQQFERDILHRFESILEKRRGFKAGSY